MSPAQETEHADDQGAVKSLGDGALHGARDGSVSLVAALPLALISVFLLARWERIRRR